MMELQQESISHFTMENYFTKLWYRQMSGMNMLHTRGEQCHFRLRQHFLTLFQEENANLPFSSLCHTINIILPQDAAFLSYNNLRTTDRI